MRNYVANKGIVVPSYANLRLYGCGYELSVTLRITSKAFPFLRDILNVKEQGYRFEGFCWNGRFYGSIIKFSEYRNFDQQRLISEAKSMLKALKLSLRDAKIRQLRMELEEIKNDII